MYADRPSPGWVASVPLEVDIPADSAKHALVKINENEKTEARVSKEELFIKFS
jgi:hypothetical protein